MESKDSIGSHAGYQVQRGSGIITDIRHIGIIDARVIDAEGNLKGEYRCYNRLVNGGVNYMLNRCFFTEANQPYAAVNTAASNGPGWFLGLIESAKAILDDDDTNNVLAVPAVPRWDDFANYDSTAKPAYATLTELETRASTGIPTSRSIANNAPGITISITTGSSVPVGGVYALNKTGLTTSAATDLLLSTARFSTEPSVSGGDSLIITYTHQFGASTDLP